MSKKQYDALNQAYTELKDNHKKVQDDYARNNGELNAILTELADVSGKTASLKTDVESGNARITQADQISERITGLKDRIAQLEKEVSLDKFATVLEGAMLRARDAKRERLTLACAGDVRNIPIDEIVYFEVSDRIVEVHYSGEVFEFYSTLDKIENQLYGRNFIRSHKSFLVNAEHIDIVRGNEIVMDSGDIIPIGSKYAKYFSEVNTQ